MVIGPFYLTSLFSPSPLLSKLKHIHIDSNKSLDGFGMLKDMLVKIHHNTFLSFMVNVMEHRHIQITSYAEGTDIFYEQPFSIFMSKGRNKILYFVTTSYQTIRRFIHSSHELDTSISICLLWWMFCFM